MDETRAQTQTAPTRGVSLTREQLDNIFTYHAPVGNQAERYEQLREKGRELAVLINDLCPDSREKSTAITNLQSTIQWANASIAINETGSQAQRRTA